MSFRVSLTLDLFLPQSSIGYMEIFREEKLSSEIHLPLSLLFPNVSASSLPFSFSSGVGGWDLHHPPVLFPPQGHQSRIQHHGQLPGGECGGCADPLREG